MSADDRPDFIPGEVPESVQKALDELEFDAEGDTAMGSLATVMHETAEVFENTGFSRSEALYMCLGVFSGNPGIPPKP